MTEHPLAPPTAETPPQLLRPLFEQFARPSGWLGRIAGSLMAKGADDDRWLVTSSGYNPTIVCSKSASDRAWLLS